MNKQNTVYPYHGILSAINRKEELIHATIWMTLENIILSKRSQTQKIIYESIYMKRVEQTSLWKQKADSWWPGLWEGVEVTASGY